MNRFLRRRVYVLAITIIVLLVAIGFLLGCRSPVPAAQHAEMYPQFAAMRAELRPIAEALLVGSEGVATRGVAVDGGVGAAGRSAAVDERASAVSSTGAPGSTSIPTIRRYYRTCTAGVPGARHEAGFVTLDDVPIAVHIFVPSSKAPVGSVFLLHGYLSHALDHAALIRRLLGEGYVVVAPELPGHGLSGGVRGSIDTFSEYGAFLAAVIDAVTGGVPQPWHAVGHSTGAVAILEAFYRGVDPFDRVVFAAPLVRNHMYRAALVGRTVTRPIVSTVPTKYDSPLGVSRMPLRWFDAQVSWNRSLSTRESTGREVYVIQGDRDRVVAWRYNRDVLSRTVDIVEYRIIRDAPHILFQVGDTQLRETAIDATMNYLSGPQR